MFPMRTTSEPTPADLPEIHALVVRSIGHVFPLPSDVLTRCLTQDGSWRPEVRARVDREDGTAIGFAYLTTHDRSLPERPHPRLQAVVVDPVWRRRGIGRKLADDLIAGSSEGRVAAVECGGGHAYLWPAIPVDLDGALAFSEALGFQPNGTSYDLRSSPETTSLARSAASLAAQLDVDIAPVVAEGSDEVVRFVAASFEPGWAVDLRADLDDGLAPNDLVVARDAGGRLVGFARIHRDRRQPLGPPLYWSDRIGSAAGGLGPIGVSADHRGRGLGSALLGRALGILAARGGTDVVIDFTDQLGFYGRLGFAPWLTYRHATREP